MINDKWVEVSKYRKYRIFVSGAHVLKTKHPYFLMDQMDSSYIQLGFCKEL